MLERLYKKGLEVGIIIVFISMSCLTSVSSKDISISDDKIMIDSNENEPEICKVDYDYAIIGGYCQYLSGKGFIFLRDAYFGAGDFDRYLEIDLYRFPQTHVHYEDLLTEITADYFIPLCWYVPAEPIKGIAFGNIEWSR